LHLSYQKYTLVYGEKTSIMKKTNPIFIFIFLAAIAIVFIIKKKNIDDLVTAPSSATNLQKNASISTELSPEMQKKMIDQQNNATKKAIDILKKNAESANNEYAEALKNSGQKPDIQLDANNQPLKSDIRPAKFSNVFNQDLVNFSNTAKIETNFPVDFKYQKIDIDGLKGFRAKNNDAEIIMVASPISKTDAEVISFLSDPTASLPGLNNFSSADIANQKNYTPPTDSSISNIRYIYKSEGTNSTLLAIAERADGKGQYLSVISGTQPYMDSNEDRFEQIIKNIRAR